MRRASKINPERESLEMPSLLERLPSGSRIAVIRLRSLGDCVLTTPALALLKENRPDLRVAVVVEDRFRAIFEGNPDIDEILPPRISEIMRWRPRLALNLHGGTRSMALTAASGAGIRVGFGHHRHSFLYSAKIPRAQEILGEERPVHTAEHIASAMFWLGVPRKEIPRARLIAGDGVGKSADAARKSACATAVLHPFASEPAKTWPADRFVEIAKQLPDSLFIAGPNDDTSPFKDFRVLIGAPLADVKMLISQA